jgi:hypothetical protein
MNKTKSFTLLSGNEEGCRWLIECFVKRNGTLLNAGRLSCKPERQHKAFILLQGYDEGWAWHISAIVKSTGGFNNKGSLSFQQQAGEYRFKLRDGDRKWVKRHLPASFRSKYPHNHHDWSKDGIMYILTKEEHKNIHKALKRRKKEEETYE